mgnify:CR=1 FL=1
MLLKAVFWDYPELCDEKNLREILKYESKNSEKFVWLTSRLLENGRVKDVRSFFSWDEISEFLKVVRISTEQRKKWERFLEVYTNRV